MTKTLEAVFDGEVFRPENKTGLMPHKHYILVVREKTEESSTSDAWEILGKLTGSVEAPEDWALEHNHYLYGVPRKTKEPLS